MAQLVKVESEAQIKSPPSKFYGFFKDNMSQLMNVFPESFETVQLLEGTDGCVGNVKLFKMLMGKRTVTMKVRAEELNDEERIIIYNAFEGNHTKLYSSLKSIISVRNGSVKWAIEVEKANESAPNPDRYLTFSIQSAMAVDAYLLNH
ncbi:MLP-like protein 43 [Henckelia pumila]|uniref:MLP-like protein 43 n=1 Tax=Henckelia pumila TaxID=405737 RepID=UPI003C6DFB0D